MTFKKTFGLALLVTLASTAAFAAGDGASDEKQILESTIVTSTLQLMNAKNDNTCSIETSEHAPQGVNWYCMGLLMPITKPELERTSCFFVVNIKCANEFAVVSGDRSSYYLRLPSGRSDVEATPSTLSFSGISIHKN